MTGIHQVYCTHCTYGSSAIERRQGDSEDRVLGYSARASSFQDLAELRKQYRTIERYLYYYLPNKVPSERKLELTPQDAPHRLFFIPSAAGLQLAGQVSYRQWDVARRRPGSYFAHVLVSDQADAERWSILDCLQLWGAAGWKLEDTDTIPFDLDAFNSVSEVLKDPLTDVTPSRPTIDDAAFLSFLTTPANGEFDVAIPELIPPRWPNAAGTAM